MLQTDVLKWAFTQAKENVERKYDFVCDHNDGCFCDSEAQDKVMLNKLEEFLYEYDWDCAGNLILFPFEDEDE